MESKVLYSLATFFAFMVVLSCINWIITSVEGNTVNYALCYVIAFGFGAVVEGLEKIKKDK